MSYNNINNSFFILMAIELQFIGEQTSVAVYCLCYLFPDFLHNVDKLLLST